MRLETKDAHFWRSSRLSRFSAMCLLLACSCIAAVQAQPTETLRNVIQLTASGQVEVDQDWLQLQLSATHEGGDAASVQKQLQQKLDAAMKVLKPQAQGQDMQVRSGSFGVYPRHDSNGKIKGWQGRAEIVLEGKDFARISQAAANVEGLTIASMGFGLSKEGRQQVQEQAQAEAIENFKNRASLLAKQFGFANYSLREVRVNSQDGNFAPRMMRANAPMAAAAKMEMAEAIPVEAGKTQVTVDVSGSVQLQ